MLEYAVQVPFLELFIGILVYMLIFLEFYNWIYTNSSIVFYLCVAL